MRSSNPTICIFEADLKKPDFYIVGAPKCGTTGMHAYLSEHPDIHMVEKELHFWGGDLRYLNPRLPKSEYQKHFEGIANNQLVGEAAVWYLLSEKAAEELYAFSPNAKIVIMLRNPVSAVSSLHSQMVYTGNEPLEELEEALKAESQRMNGESLPEHYYCPQQGLCYTSVYKYQEQIKRYIDTFGKDKIHFIFFDDLKENTAKVYRELLDFLNINTNFAPDFEVVNANKTTRNKNIQKLILSPGQSAKKVVKALIPSKKIREKIKGKLWDANSKETQRSPISDAVKTKLQTHFESQIEFLKELKSAQKLD